MSAVQTLTISVNPICNPNRKPYARGVSARVRACVRPQRCHKAGGRQCRVVARSELLKCAGAGKEVLFQLVFIKYTRPRHPQMLAVIRASFKRSSNRFPVIN